MIVDEDNAPIGGAHGEDQSVDRARDLATGPPPKSLDTVTAASEAAEKVDAQGAAEAHEHRVKIRAYELWEQNGRPEGSPHDFWRQAEAEVASDAAQD